MGVIQTYSDLQAAVADNIARTDLTNEILDWINAANVRIQEYVGPLAPLVIATSTNQLLSYDPYVYLWGALAEGYFFLRNNDQAEIYQEKFEARLSELAMSGFEFLAMKPAVHPPRQILPFSNRYLWAANTALWAANATGG